MYLSSGFRASTLCLTLASVIIYNSVFTNAKDEYVAVKGKYVKPMSMIADKSLEFCLSKTNYGSFIACFLIFSPSMRSCGFVLAQSCDDAVMGRLENSAKGDSTVYMRTTYAGSSTLAPTSQSPSVAPFATTETSNAVSSTATISASTGITIQPQSTSMHISSSVLTPTSTDSDIVVSNPTSIHIVPTATGKVSKSTFTSEPVTSYQEIITTSIEIFDSSQPIMTELFSDRTEVTPATSILMTSSFGTMPVSEFPSSVHDDTTSEKTSGEITAGSTLFTNAVPTSSVSPDGEMCQCECSQPPLTDQELEKSIADLRKELTVDKKNLSRTIRSKTSAPDDRPSATGIGMTGVVVLIACFLFLVAADLPHLYQHALIMKRNLMS